MNPITGKNFLNRHRLWLLFLLAFIVRIAAVVVIDISTEVPSQGFLSSSGREFAALTHNLVSGEGYSLHTVRGRKLPSAYMPPGYVFFLAPLFLLFGEGLFTFILVQGLQALLGALTCPVLARLSDEAFPRPVGTVAGLLMAVYPPLIYPVAEPHSLTIYVLLNLLLVRALLNVPRERAAGNILLAGALAGVLALFRSEMAIFVIFLAIWMWGGKGKRRPLFHPALFIVTAFLVVMPWTLRNYRVFHRVVPIHTSSGYDFSRGHNPDATGTGLTFEGVPIEPASGILGIEERIAALPPTDDWEVRKDEIYMEAALDYIAAHPWRAVKLAFVKFFFFWSIDFTYPLARHPLYWLSWLGVSLPAVLGLVRAVKDKIGISLICLYLIFYTALEMTVFVLPRHRLFIEPFVLILTAYGLTVFWESRRRRALGSR